jgi:NAD+ kinase
LKNASDQIKRIGLIGNNDKTACADIVRQAVHLIKRARRIPVAGDDAAKLARETDLILVFGGDGTMLRAARETAGLGTPLLGVNIGGLGFLTAVSSDHLADALKNLWRGEIRLEPRALIEVTGQCQGRKIRAAALNDIVVSRGAVSRLIALDVSVDDEIITRYRCDGLIVSSPTGSTAYSLAAGGAIVLPTADVFTLTPICPHALSNRSIILPLSSAVRIKAATPSHATILSADGQFVAELDPGDVVTIRRSRRAVRLVRLANSSFLEAMRRKLHWRGTYL